MPPVVPCFIHRTNTVLHDGSVDGVEPERHTIAATLELIAIASLATDGGVGRSRGLGIPAAGSELNWMYERARVSDIL